MIAGAVCALGGNCSAAPALGFIPVVGPLLQIRRDVGSYPVGIAVLASGTQALGLLGVAAGLAFPEPLWVRDRAGQRRVSIRLSPTGLAGEF